MGKLWKMFAKLKCIRDVLMFQEKENICLLNSRKVHDACEMKKLGKKSSLVSSWERPFLFVNYLDGNGFMEQDEKGRICVVKGKEEKL
jgi:hypothetical protein